jgi:hypothetical protein
VGTPTLSVVDCSLGSLAHQCLRLFCNQRTEKRLVGDTTVLDFDSSDSSCHLFRGRYDLGRCSQTLPIWPDAVVGVSSFIFACHSWFVAVFLDCKSIVCDVRFLRPHGPANRGQPLGSETNRTSAAAGPGGWSFRCSSMSLSTSHAEEDLFKSYKETLP